MICYGNPREIHAFNLTLYDAKFRNSAQDFSSVARTQSSYTPINSFHLAKGEAKHYRQQYGDLYFLRLAMLKPAVEGIANEAWEGYQVTSCSKVESTELKIDEM